MKTSSTYPFETAYRVRTRRLLQHTYASTSNRVEGGPNCLAYVARGQRHATSGGCMSMRSLPLRWLVRITLFFYLLLLKRRRKIIEKYFSGPVFHAEYDYAIVDYDRLPSKSLISLQNHDQIYRVESIFLKQKRQRTCQTNEKIIRL